MRLFFVLVLLVGISANAQVDTCCAGNGRVSLKFDYVDMLEQIQAYEDTIMAITGNPIDEDYRLLEYVDSRLYQRYDGFDLELAIYNLRVALAQARASAGDGVCAPCSMFNGIMTYNGDKYSPREICHDSGNYCFLPTLYNEAFRNGDSIPTLASNADWSNATGPALSDHPFIGTSPSGLGLQPFSHYGHHFNLHALVDERKLCPPGWALIDSARANTANAEDELHYVMRREPDGTWIEDETWTVTGTLPGSGPYSYEDNAKTVTMYGLAFAGTPVPGMAPFYAKNSRNSTFGLPSPNSGYLSVSENHGVTVGCELLGFVDLANDPYYIEWENIFGDLYPDRLAAGEQWVANNILLTGDEAPLWSEFHDFPHVRTEDFTLDGGNIILNGDLYYSIHSSEVGFVVGNSADLSVADTLIATTADSIEVSNGVFRAGGKFALEVTPTGPMYFSAFAKAGSDNSGDRYMFGDTLQVIIP